MQSIWSGQKRNFSAEEQLLAARFHNELPEGVNIYQKAKYSLAY